MYVQFYDGITFRNYLHCCEQ